ncbi:hypothetical protein [uncultured Roseobacter sp.]|uniref:hypothetical protein n=1 Tax=uncultured Roseobacter sp. TaxID=114847 RepID=UPI0026212830|nr:hypothetical protein [uncultured Roseobacter sp.]
MTFRTTIAVAAILVAGLGFVTGLLSDQGPDAESAAGQSIILQFADRAENAGKAAEPVAE